MLIRQSGDVSLYACAATMLMQLRRGACKAGAYPSEVLHINVTPLVHLTGDSRNAMLLGPDEDEALGAEPVKVQASQPLLHA